ncbi:MAG: hypothetical protein IJV04_02740 [Lachnospiraceae bacterium]|nr:hypothetical protein [Lachnospiraceae bacterium]
MSEPLVMSRDCIRDTMLMKRLCRDQMKGIALELYIFNMQELRRGQLAPHVETKMLPNRFLEMQKLKRAAPEIVVVLRDGLIQQVLSTNRFAKVYIADYDVSSDEEYERTEEAEERGSMASSCGTM